MRKIANINKKDRAALFTNTANKMAMTEAIIEKDFWVCYVLDFLFNDCQLRDRIVFKGGTSLSKAYGLISRFSEDIDLILDWRVLGFTKDEPLEQRSVSKQDAFNKDIEHRTSVFLTEHFTPMLQAELSARLSDDISVKFDNERQAINIIYPQIFSDSAILQEICLEIGPLAAWTPTENRIISPYSAESYPHLFNTKSTTVTTVKPTRTFWEKATILHREANRTNDSLPTRYSRHYYDLFCMAKSSVKNEALADRELLHSVADFKNKFYHCNWAKYDEAKKGMLTLVPKTLNIITKLKNDYSHMQNMLFGEKPTFDEILELLQQLENEINKT